MSSLIAPNQDIAAATVGVNSRTLQRWIANGCPGKTREYVICDIVKWAKENIWSEEATLIETATGEPGDIKTMLLEAKHEKLKREIDLAELKIGEQSSQLVDADQMRAELAEKSSTIRSGLETLERQHGPEALDLVLEIFDEALGDCGGSETDY